MKCDMDPLERHAVAAALKHGLMGTSEWSTASKACVTVTDLCSSSTTCFKLHVLHVVQCYIRFEDSKSLSEKKPN